MPTLAYIYYYATIKRVNKNMLISELTLLLMRILCLLVNITTGGLSK